MVYLFIGEDEFAKAEKIRSLKKQLLNPSLEQFNSEVFRAGELTLPLFKEALSRLPAASKNRFLVIREALRLKEGLQEYFLGQFKRLPDSLVIILDIAAIPKEENSFLNKILKIAKVLHFKAVPCANAFNLARAIRFRQPDYALNILSDLFKQGERPERILGALRYQLVKHSVNLKDKSKAIELLLETDVNIKTGRLKPGFALETLVVKLCR